MKKFLVMSAMIASLIAVAGPKADLDKANKLINENKVEEAVKVLKSSKPAKGEETEYEYINYILATNFANNDNEAISYLKKASANKKSTSDFAIDANLILAKVAKTNKEKISLYEEYRSRLKDEDYEILAILSKLYTLEKDTKKLKSIEKVVNSKNDEFKAWYNYYLGTIFYNDDEAKGMSYLNKALNSKSNKVKSETYFTLAQIAAIKKDFSKVDSNIDKAVKLNPKEINLLIRVYDLYLSTNNLDKAYTYIKKAYELAPNDTNLLLEVFSFANYTKSKDEAKYLNILQKQYKVSNIELASVLYNKLIYDGAIKYALLAEKENFKEASMILAISYARKNDKKTALKYAEKAVKDKVTGAEDLLNEIKKLK